MSLPDKKDARTAEAFERFNADMAAVFQEGIQLERQGLLDEKAKMQIEAKCCSFSFRLVCSRWLGPWQRIDGPTGKGPVAKSGDKARGKVRSECSS